ncbi:MAG: thioredoxin family protein [Pseudomonadota bacterium]
MARKIKKLIGIVFAVTAIAAFAGPETRAGDAAPVGVVELFTSQGCNSCPPADAVLGELARQGDLIALSYHVDYWNYLGWEDTLSSKESTDRQYDYARTLGRKSVYTPQVIVNGRDHINGADKQGINKKVSAFDKSGRGLTVPIEATMEGDKIKINIGEGAGKADVIIVYFDRENAVDIERGENGGRNLVYWNSVRDIQTVAMWDGDAVELDLPAHMMSGKGYDGCAVLLQTMRSDGVPGAIIGAGVVMDSKSS